jgi:F-type H+-transporting ATPase subunit gamma
MFLKGEVSAVDIVFPRFINTLTQQPATIPFLPIGKLSAATAGVNAPPEELVRPATTEVFDFEPDEEIVLGALLPHSLNFQMHQILLETKASEQSARMVAMKNATDNAKQIIKDLTLEYNKLRQANITKELLEITTAQMAVG